MCGVTIRIVTFKYCIQRFINFFYICDRYDYSPIRLVIDNKHCCFFPHPASANTSSNKTAIFFIDQTPSHYYYTIARKVIQEEMEINYQLEIIILSADMLIRISCVVVGFDDSVLFKKYKPAIP